MDRDKDIKKAVDILQKGLAHSEAVVEMKYKQFR
jgi:hypothetical protein